MKRQTILKSILCFLMALACNVAWAQTFVMPEPGKYYKLKGDNQAGMPWLTNQLKNGTSGSIIVSAEETDAAVFKRTGNGLMEITTGKYLGTSGVVTLVANEAAVVIGDYNDDNATGNGVKYSVKAGGSYMYNNNTDGVTHESSGWIDNIERYWGFIEVDEADAIALSKTSALAHVEANKDFLGSNIGYCYYVVNGKTATDPKGVKNAINSAETLDAIIAIKNSFATNLPKEGVAYKMAFKTKAGALHHFTVDGTSLSTSTDAGNASVFYCKKNGSGDFVYIFISEDGKYLKFHTTGKTSDSPNTLTDNYTSELNNFKVEAMIDKTANIDSEKPSRLGTVCIIADKRVAGNDDTDGCYILNNNANPPTFDVSAAPFHKDGLTSAIVMTEVEGYDIDADANSAVKQAVLNIAKTEAQAVAKAHVTANASKLGEGIGYAYYMAGETKLYTADEVNAAIDEAATIEDVNAIKNSFKYEVPQTGTLYTLYDATHSVYLDIHNLGADDQAPSYNQLATMNANKQFLYITGNKTNGTWKIHSTPEGGNYLHKNSTKAWDSWVSSEGSDFNWEIEVNRSGEEITYSLKTSNSEGTNHVGSTTRLAGQELYVDVAHANALVFKLVEANVTPEEELAYIKMATKAALTQYTAKLKNQIGYYYCTINGTKVYDAAEVNVAIDDAATKEAVAEIAEAVKASSVVLPEPGKAYTMTLVANNNEKTQYKIIATDGTLEAKTEGENSVFYCLQSNSNDYPYIFVSEDGYVLGYSKLVANYHSGDNRHNFKVEGMYDKSSSHITSAASARLGMVCITTAARNADTGGGGVGCIIFKYSGDGAPKWDNSNAPYHDGTYTSAIVMTEVENYEMPDAQRTKVDAILGKDAVKTQVEAIKDELKNQPGYYYCTIGGEKYYDADAILALIDATQSLKTLNEISTAVTQKTLILPEAGKYYRIAYDYGNNGGVKYLQSTYHSGSNLALTDNKDESSLFYVEQVGENLRLKSYTTGKYIKEDGNTRGLHDVGGNVTFSAGSNTGKIKIQATSYLHASTSDDKYYIDHCGSDNASHPHNFMMEEVPSYALTIDAPAPAGATATWNGETKALPATWTICEGMTITNPELTLNYDNVNYTFGGLFEGEQQVELPLEITTLEANRNFTAKFSPAFFSKSTKAEDLVPVRIRNVRNNDYTIRLNTPNNGYTGQAINSGVTAYGENEIWYLVGNEESFKIYHRIAGTDLHIVLAGTSENSAASMGNTDTNADFCLQPSGAGYTICPTGNKNQSFNMNGGAGKDIKLYKTSDGGSNWYIEKMDVTNILTLNVNVDQVWESSPRVAELTITIDGLAGQTRILGNVEGQALYLPVGATYEVSSMTYRGYTYNGCTNDNGTLTASYTANDERTLYYNREESDGKPNRIPAIATAPNGDIFAISDHRPCGNDIGYGEVDLVCRVSSDNGVTWTESKTIADGLGHINDGIWKMGYGDPAIVADRESNKVLVMSVCGNRTCWDGNYGEGGENENPNRISRLYIEHDGEKWVYGLPEEVTYDIYPLFKNEGGEAYAASLFIGAGKICQSRVVKKGEYYRLYCSVWVVTKSIRTHHNYVIYSDDFGQTWNVLGGVGNDANPSQPGPAFGGNEPKCEELPDGTVVLSSRKSGGRYFNLFTFNDDTYTSGSWGTVVSSNDITGGLSFGGNSTNGEIYKVKAIHKESGRICDIMLQSIPTGGGRDNVAIYYKEMEYNANGTNKYTPTTFAQGWTKGKHVSTKGSAYSTMILQADGRLGFYFEEEPGDQFAYCLVYIPYSIEDVTGGAYSLYTVNSTIGQYEIGTFYASEAMQIPDGIKAYVATNAPVMNDGVGVITMEELEGIIPAKTGAVLRGEAKTYEFIPSISYGTAVENNMLVGFEGADNKAETKKEVTLADGYTTYVLTVMDGKAGFYRKDAGFKVYNNKAYLNVPGAAGARALYFDFDNDATGIVETENESEKTEIYDLVGRRVQKVQKGLYIVNGKKVLK